MDEQPSYNLLKEQWIPVVLPGGQLAQFSLSEIFSHAHHILELGGEVPIVTASLYRLLLAVLHSALRGPTDESAWSTLWEQGHFDGDKISAYLHRWEERFDLFHPQRPFYQADDPRVKKPKSVISLIPHAASGNNATLFDHHSETQGLSLLPDQAARYLLTALTFGLGGLSGIPKCAFTDAPWARGAIFLVKGQNLFETLMLNLLAYPDREVIGFPSTEQDRPAWEQDDPFLPERTQPLGYLDYLTWHNRRVRLFPEWDGQQWCVRQMTAAPALRLDADLLDPMKFYQVKDKKKGWRPLLFSENRVLWRDSAAILTLHATAEGMKRQPPRALAWLSRLIYYDVISSTMNKNLLALGMKCRPGQAKILFYRQERLPLPLEYLQREELVEVLQTSLDHAEAVRSQLWGAANTLAAYYLTPTLDVGGEEQHEPQKEDKAALLKQWDIERDYWVNLALPFYEMMETLPQGDHDQALLTWLAQLRTTARSALERVTAALGDTPRALKAAIKARGQLESGLVKVLGKENPVA